MSAPLLYPYQYEGAVWLAANERALLADGMGLGKTPQAVVAARMVGAQLTVVLCPAIARTMWAREWERWGGPGELLVYSYDSAVRNPSCEIAMATRKPDLLICDEAHYLKSRTSKRTKLVYGDRCDNTGIAAHAGRVWLLTGTPAPNDVGELWPHLRALWPAVLEGDKGYMAYINEYCRHMATTYGIRVLGNKVTKIAKLRALLHNVMRRRQVEDVLPDLPPIIWQHQTVDVARISPELRALEAAPETLAALAVLGDVEADPAELDAVALSTLRRLTGAAKAPAVAQQLLEELRENAYKKVVIFAVHKDVLATMREALAEFNPAYIDGSVPQTQRAAAIDRFQTDPACRVFIGQLQACATAVTLHAASQVVFCEMSWAPADNLQAAKRAHRIGQRMPVTVRMFGLAGSIDDAVTRVLARKCRQVDEVIETEVQR